jgi:hypothetical protein
LVVKLSGKILAKIVTVMGSPLHSTLANQAANGTP